MTGKNFEDRVFKVDDTSINDILREHDRVNKIIQDRIPSLYLSMNIEMDFNEWARMKIKDELKKIRSEK